MCTAGQAARRSATPTLDQEILLMARRQRLDLQLAYEKELLKHAVEAYKEEQEAARARELVRAAAALTRSAPRAARGRTCWESGVARCMQAPAARGTRGGGRCSGRTRGAVRQLSGLSGGAPRPEACQAGGGRPGVCAGAGRPPWALADWLVRLGRALTLCCSALAGPHRGGGARAPALPLRPQARGRRPCADRGRGRRRR
jgi:hypothetical protein